MQKEAPKKYQQKVFEEFKELKEQRGNEALGLVQNILIKWEGERERARILQRFGGSRAIRHWNDARDVVSVESCSLSMACDMEEAGSESSRKMLDKEETTSEASWTAVTKGKGKEVWRLEPQGESERPEATAPWNGVEGVSVNGQKSQGRKEKIKPKWKRRWRLRVRKEK